jgi:predicted ATPase
MRVAVSGTHGVGKSTLIDEFLTVHSDYIHEPEPYTTLVEDFGEEFSAEPTVDDFLRQLDFSITTLAKHARDEKVIYERCPLDFLAYIEALEPDRVQNLLGPISTATRDLDLIVYLPIEDKYGTPEEYPKLRKAVDRRLNSILLDDDFGILSTPVVEATGSTAQRLRIVEEAMQRTIRRK